MQQTERKPLFNLGQLVATPGALMALEKSGRSPMDFLSRHVTGDWGDLLPQSFHNGRGFPNRRTALILAAKHGTGFEPPRQFSSGRTSRSLAV
jgi:hypothetical protein